MKLLIHWITYFFAFLTVLLFIRAFNSSSVLYLWFADGGFSDGGFEEGGFAKGGFAEDGFVEGWVDDMMIQVEKCGDETGYHIRLNQTCTNKRSHQCHITGDSEPLVHSCISFPYHDPVSSLSSAGPTMRTLHSSSPMVQGTKYLCQCP